MADISLLPPNSTALERLISQALAEGTALPSGDLLRSLYNAQTCPADLLSYLAQAVAVDLWDHRWPAEQKREVIAQALEIHRTKGTPLALLRALESRGITATLREWWQQQDPSWYLPPTSMQPGTIVVQTLLNENIGLDQATMAKMHDAFTHAKRESIHISHEMGLKWDESLAHSGAIANPVGYLDNDAKINPLNPESGLIAIGAGSVAGLLTLADFEFNGEIT